MSLRSVQFAAKAVDALEGEGFLVHRPFPTKFMVDLDPFLLLDEMGPMVYEPGEAKGAPDHPHRGFETVTYLLSGEFQHKDSAGNQGTLRSGDVQWMTAGAGVVHSEMPSLAFQKSGGKLHGFQLWVNLKKTDKMITPRYQEYAHEEFPVTEIGGSTIKVIAGELNGLKSPIETKTPMLYYHIHLAPEKSLRFPVPSNFNVMAYVIHGGLTHHPIVPPHSFIIFNKDGDFVEVTSAGSETEFLLIGGEPIGEPVARYGPFVMNTKEEIHQAFADYQSGKMGIIS